MRRGAAPLRRATLALLAPLAVALGATAWAQPGAADGSDASGTLAVSTSAEADFDPERDGWNGLRYLRDTAREAEVELDVRRQLDWSTLSGKEILVVVAPHASLDARDESSLQAFVRHGGRVVLADDFRAGASWVRGFGIRRVAQPGAAPATVPGRPAMPIFLGAEVGPFLGFQVDEITLNHPAAWVVEPAPGVERVAHGRYVDGVRAWLVEARLGQGRLLALADPSVLIDAMLRTYHGDKQFAANVLRWGCYAGESCRVLLLPNLRALRGVFTPPAGEGGRPPGLLTAFERGLERLAAVLKRREMVPVGWLATLLALLLPALLAARLPRARMAALGARVPDESRLGATVAAWLARPDADYRRPARQLAGQFARLVQTALGQDPTETPTPAELRADIARLSEAGRLPRQAVSRLGDVLENLTELTSVDADVDRARFNHLAAEVEWAEHVLRHTRDELGTPRARSGPGRGAARA